MNRNTLILLTILAGTLLAVTAFAQDEGDTTESPATGPGTGVCRFLDEDGDGFNDLAPDADGDGIPNGQDEDYVRPQDGTGSQYRHQKQVGKNVDGEVKSFARKGNRNGSADGTGTGSGVCDGTGPGFGTGTCRLTDTDGAKSAPTRGCRGGRK